MFPQRTIVVIMKDGKTHHSFYFSGGTLMLLPVEWIFTLSKFVA